jgi:hypothetical protein
LAVGSWQLAVREEKGKRQKAKGKGAAGGNSQFAIRNSQFATRNSQLAPPRRFRYFTTMHDKMLREILHSF